MSNANVIFRMMVNKYGLDNLGIQNVYTPVNKIEEATGIKFFDFINSETRNIGVLFNWEFIYTVLEEAAKNNYTDNIKFTYFYDSEADKNALNFNGFDKYRFAKVNYEIEFVNISEFTEQNKDVKVIEKAMAGKHFDIVFSNPPYGNIDLKILQVLYTNNITDNAVFIHPAGWLFDLKEKSQAMQFKAALKNYLKSAFIFDGCKVFKTSTGDNLEFHFPEVITVFSNNKADTEKIQITDELIHKTYQADTIFDISIFHDMKKLLFNNLISKTQKDNLLIHTSNDKKYTFALMRIIGNARKADNTKNSGYPYFGPKFFTLIPKNMEDQSNYTMKTHDVFSFDTEAELNNFKKFLTTKVARICLAWLKISQHIDSGRAACVPWLDFTQEWNDAKLCEEFNIDEELWQYIDKFIPDYYEDYKSGF